MRNFRQDFYLAKFCFDIVERGRTFVPWLFITNDITMRAVSFASLRICLPLLLIPHLKS